MIVQAVPDLQQLQIAEPCAVDEGDVTDYYYKYVAIRVY